MKDSFKRAFVRLGRVAAAQAVVLGTDFAFGALAGVKLPSGLEPLLPIVVAPFLNAGAKILRDTLDPESASLVSQSAQKVAQVL